MSFLFLSTLVVVLAGLHVSEARRDYVEVELFGVGMSATAVYTAPGDGRTTIDLLDADGGVVLHMDYRFEWAQNPYPEEPWEDILILNTKPANGSWGTEQHVNDFYFTPRTNVELTAKAEDGHFAIIANGLQVATYNYRLPVESVKRMQFSTTSGSGSELVSFTTGYKMSDVVRGDRFGLD